MAGLENFDNVRAAEDLPYAHSCGVRWAGVNTSHCGACHFTFTGVRAFDQHRPEGVCTHPDVLGMRRAPGRAYEAWS